MQLVGQLLLQLVLLVNQLLLPLDVLEHVLGLREDHVVGEDLGVLVVEAAKLGQADLSLWLGVVTLQELVDVVEDEIILEDGDYVGVLVVDKVVYDFKVIVVSVSRVLLAKVVLNHKALLIF